MNGVSETLRGDLSSFRLSRLMCRERNNSNVGFCSFFPNEMVLLISAFHIFSD